LLVREVGARLDEELAYTTVMTVLVRLHEKGIVAHPSEKLKMSRRRCSALWTV
jgi:predicted transcriptional regulator